MLIKFLLSDAIVFVHVLLLEYSQNIDNTHLLAVDFYHLVDLLFYPK